MDADGMPPETLATIFSARRSRLGQVWVARGSTADSAAVPGAAGRGDAVQGAAVGGGAGAAWGLYGADYCCPGMVHCVLCTGDLSAEPVSCVSDAETGPVGGAGSRGQRGQWGAAASAAGRGVPAVYPAAAGV
ncbi:hypothetical protein PMAC_000694 [Pneumocystis sp. 'macacae']|nr:hypothetical protein PMAC_000694 [Pneumocystis sp. 'macacae']